MSIRQAIWPRDIVHAAGIVGLVILLILAFVLFVDLFVQLPVPP